MSTLAVGTIKSVSSAAPVFQNSSGTEKGQLAKAWVTYNASTVVQDSFGISSVADTATGNKTVNFSTNFSSINYAVATMASEQDNAAFSLVEENTRAVGSCIVITRTSRVTGKTNFDLVCAIFFGDN